MFESTAQRSKTMRAVKSKDTKPELLVRKLLFKQGYRYRLHQQDLPGKPDIVFRSRKKVIFVHGCFWHGHNCRRGSRVPKSNAEYWCSKVLKNKIRFNEQKRLLEDKGWSVFIVWECEMKDDNKLFKGLKTFLN